MNFGELLIRMARRFPDKTAIVFEGRRSTFSQLDRRSNQLANALAGLGAVRGRRLALVCQNSVQYVEVAFACAKAGVVLVNLNWRLSAGELEGLLAKEQPSVVFFSHCQRAAYESIRTMGKLPPARVSIGGPLPDALAYEEVLAGESEAFRCLDVTDETALMHVNSSGTTGFPKSIVYSHRGMISQIMGYALQTHLDENTVFQQLSPLFHSACLGAYCALSVGATVVLTKNFEVSAFLRSIEEERVTRIAVVPRVLRQMLYAPQAEQFDLSSLKVISYSAAPMPRDVLDMALRRFRCTFYQSYGMTEMGPIISLLLAEDHTLEQENDARRYSVGREMIGASIRVVDERGADCPVRTVGEIIAKGYGMMKCYYAQPEETAAAIRDGWYHTSDLGYFDEDRYLYLAGRRSDMIISGGENIYPLEIENCILQMEQDVAEAAVFGVSDLKWGESPAAVIVRKPGSRVTEKEVLAHCAERIASYKKPRYIQFVDALPRNDGGKIQKHKLMELFH